jgi:hypothetical protein
VGLINKPPERKGRYRAYRLSGEALPGEHPKRASAALTCTAPIRTAADSSLWSCDSHAVIAAMDADVDSS